MRHFINCHRRHEKFTNLLSSSCFISSVKKRSSVSNRKRKLIKSGGSIKVTNLKLHNFVFYFSLSVGVQEPTVLICTNRGHQMKGLYFEFLAKVGKLHNIGVIYKSGKVIQTNSVTDLKASSLPASALVVPRVQKAMSKESLGSFAPDKSDMSATTTCSNFELVGRVSYTLLPMFVTEATLSHATRRFTKH